jgi:hypothetical protein
MFTFVNFDGEASEFLPENLATGSSVVAFGPETGQNNFASLNLQGQSSVIQA